MQIPFAKKSRQRARKRPCKGAHEATRRLRPIEDRARKAVVRSRDKRNCICCNETVKASESDVYEFDFSPSLKRDNHGILCDECVSVIERLNVADDDIPFFVAKVRIEAFLRRINGG